MGERLIKRIYIRKLFGLYTYDLPEKAEFSNAGILYGDNGVGKTTILRLVFHLLSPANDRGHRFGLYGTYFDQLDVDLASGITFSASRRDDKTSKVLTLEITRGTEKLAVWDFEPRSRRSVEQLDPEDYDIIVDSGGRSRYVRKVPTPPPPVADDKIPRGETAFLAATAEYAPTTFLLNADRRLDSDAVADPSDEVELRRLMRYEEPKRINDLITRSREIALSQALTKAAVWISQKAVHGTNQGSMNVHGVYVNVLRQIVAPFPATGVKADLARLTERLSAIQARTGELAKYELETPLSAEGFLTALRESSTRAYLAADLLEPYVDSVEARLAALDPVYRIVDEFVSIINSLLRDKTITFKLSQGFSIHTKLGTPLATGQLSSGEQQLLLLFCHVLIARDKPSVFMIDEPEISLNVKWQRELVQALLNITQDAKIQFLFASHSLELLAQHRDRVVKLADRS